MNGVKRAFSSPIRAIGLLFFLLTQTWWLPRFFMVDSAELSEAIAVPGFTLPPVEVIDGAVFAAFVVLVVFMALNVFGYSSGFRSADVDVLFPTPVPRRSVLHLRMLRDTLLSVLVPLILGLIFFRPVQTGWASLFENVRDPTMANTVLRVALIGYLLLALAMVMVGYAVSLVFAEPSVRVERLRKWAQWGLATGLGIVAASVVWRLRGAQGLDEYIAVTQAFDLRAVFFLATGATELTVAPLSGALGRGGLGGLLLVGTSVVAYAVAVGHTKWLYEQAALRAAVTESAQRIARQGDFYAMASESARKGKLKARSLGWLSRVRATGPPALLWKETLVLWRAGLAMQVLSLGLSLLVGGAVSQLPASRRGLAFNGALFIGAQIFILAGTAGGSSQIGFMESLRRIDLLKPLPFSGQATVLMEVLGRAAPASVGTLAGLGLGWALNPELAEYALAGMIVVPPFAVAITALALLLVLLLPDVEDPTQRAFRGLVTTLGTFALIVPAIIVFVATVAVLRVSPVVAALPTFLLLAGLAWVVTRVAAGIYANFNPSD